MGLAVGDDITGVASPLEIVPYAGVDRAAQQIADIGLEGRRGTGRPWSARPSRTASRGPASRRTDRLAEALEALGVEVALQSEFLSTDEARRRARAAGRPPRQPVDDIAAQVLLEEYLASRPARRLRRAEERS